MAQRIIATANERADLEESDSCGKVERTYPQTKHVFEKYLVEHCSPLVSLSCRSTCLIVKQSVFFGRISSSRDYKKARTKA